MFYRYVFKLKLSFPKVKMMQVSFENKITHLVSVTLKVINKVSQSWSSCFWRNTLLFAGSRIWPCHSFPAYFTEFYARQILILFFDVYFSLLQKIFRIFQEKVTWIWCYKKTANSKVCFNLFLMIVLLFFFTNIIVQNMNIFLYLKKII